MGLKDLVKIRAVELFNQEKALNYVSIKISLAEVVFCCLCKCSTINLAMLVYILYNKT